VSPILVAIYTSGLIKWDAGYVPEAEGLSFVDDLGWVATRSDVNHVVSIRDILAAKSIELLSRRVLQCNIANTEAALFTHRRGHRKYY